MPAYTAEQRRRIRDAVAATRAALRENGRYEPAAFARAFAAHGGVQIPGAPDDDRTRALARALPEVLERGAPPEDEHLAREAHRACVEARWARAAASDKVVGLYLRLGPRAQSHPACQALLAEDHGLGAGVFPKSHVLVLPADCLDYDYVPVLEDEVEQ